VAVLVNNQPLDISVGLSELGPLTLPQGSRSLLCTYECASWPVTNDGLITVTLKISDDGGSNYRNEWSDTFQHAQLKHAGVVQSNASFGIGLQAPFGANSRLKVAFNSPVSVSTTITVQAT